MHAVVSPCVSTNRRPASTAAPTTSRFGPPPGNPNTMSAPRVRTPFARICAKPSLMWTGRYSKGSVACSFIRAMMTTIEEELMAEIKQGRWTADIEGDFVVFIIGARVNSKWHPFRSIIDLGGRRGMNYMLKYLTEHPEKGMLGYQTMGFANVQYWRSFDHLEAFAKDTNDPHLEPWRKFWKRAKDGRTGIWHETFLVRDGEYEAIYGNMPPRGLGKAGNLVPVAESVGARNRLRAATK